MKDKIVTKVGLEPPKDTDTILDKVFMKFQQNQVTEMLDGSNNIEKWIIFFLFLTIRIIFNVYG